MDIKKITTESLKAIAYDNLVQLEQAQKNIKIINDELVSRTQNTQPDNNMENETTGTEVVEETSEVTGTETPETTEEVAE